MNVTDYVSDITGQMAQISPKSIPGLLWHYYLEYLWYYEQNSWVARIAYSFRWLAILVCLPLIILGLLDIASYGIARTLGIIDDVKASTSDKSTIHGTKSLPLTPMPNATFTDSERESDSGLPSAGPQVFYASDSESSNLRLSGVGVFSPAASQPSSPTVSRKSLIPQGNADAAETASSREGSQLRYRA